jgi:exosortase E/protease (VPEID-CTERM system)
MNRPKNSAAEVERPDPPRDSHTDPPAAARRSGAVALSRLAVWIVADAAFLGVVPLFLTPYKWSWLRDEARLMLPLAGQHSPDWRFLAVPVVLTVTVMVSILLEGLSHGRIYDGLRWIERRYAAIGFRGECVLLVTHWAGLALVLLYLDSLITYRPWLPLIAWLPASYMLFAFGGVALCPLLLFQFGAEKRLAGVVTRLVVALLLALVMTTVAADFGLRTWSAFSDTTLVFASAILRLFSRETTFDLSNRLLTFHAFRVHVRQPCSGIEGVGLYIVFMGLFCAIYRERLRFPRVFLLFPLGTLATAAFNVLRIALLVIIGAEISPIIALNGFHSYSGWIFFNVVALGTAFVALRSPFFSREPRTFLDLRNNPLAPYLLPLMAILAIQFFSGAMMPDFDYVYPLRVIAAIAALWYVRAHTLWDLDRKIPWGAIGIGLVTAAIWLALEPALPASGSPPWQRLSGLARPFWLLFRFTGSWITVPLAEELAFRGFVLRRAIAADFTAVPFGKLTLWSVGLSSLLFGLLHSHSIAGLSAGILFAAATRVRGKLGDTVVAHAVANASIAAFAFITGHWELWS